MVGVDNMPESFVCIFLQRFPLFGWFSENYYFGCLLSALAINSKAFCASKMETKYNGIPDAEYVNNINNLDMVWKIYLFYY